MVMFFGEITTATTVNYKQVIRDVSKASDYDDPAKGFGGYKTCKSNRPILRNPPMP